MIFFATAMRCFASLFLALEFLHRSGEQSPERLVPLVIMAGKPIKAPLKPTQTPTQYRTEEIKGLFNIPVDNSNNLISSMDIYLFMPKHMYLDK